MRPYYEDGSCTIYHADCRDVMASERLDIVDLLLTDPPYGDSHDTDYTRFSGGKYARPERRVSRRWDAISGDDAPFDPYPLLGLGRETILFGANRFSDRLPVGSWLVWDKRSPTGAKGVMSDAEVAWFSRGGRLSLRPPLGRVLQGERGAATAPPDPEARRADVMVHREGR